MVSFSARARAQANMSADTGRLLCARRALHSRAPWWASLPRMRAAAAAAATFARAISAAARGGRASGARESTVRETDGAGVVADAAAEEEEEEVVVAADGARVRMARTRDVAAACSCACQTTGSGTGAGGGGGGDGGSEGGGGVCAFKTAADTVWEYGSANWGGGRKRGRWAAGSEEGGLSWGCLLHGGTGREERLGAPVAGCAAHRVAKREEGVVVMVGRGGWHGEADGMGAES